MKSLVMFLNVMNVVSIMSGISALILSAVTFTNTGVLRAELGAAKKDMNKHHQVIPTLSASNNMTRASLENLAYTANISLKRLDKDVGKLFNDLGKSFERQKKHKAEFQKLMVPRMSETEFRHMKTYRKINHNHEKIKSNSERIEVVYGSLNERLGSVERSVKYIKGKIEYLEKILNNHTKNKTGT